MEAHSLATAGDVLQALVQRLFAGYNLAELRLGGVALLLALFDAPLQGQAVRR
jgi:hypothetical protein